MEDFKATIQKIKDKLAIMEFEDVFPLNRKCDIYNVKSVVQYALIYVGILIVAAVLWIILGAIPFVGWLFKFVGIVVAIYGVIGVGKLLFEFMRVN